VICPDWGATGDQGPLDVFFGGKPWGVEHLSVAERHYKVLTAGVDQFGGNNDSQPLIAAYKMGVEEMGEDAMRSRFEDSAVRLLKNIIRVGLFEDPYLDLEKTSSTVGKPEFLATGYKAQLKSVVLLKNQKNIIPLPEISTVYVPKRFTPAGRNFFGAPIPEKLEYPVNMETMRKYFNISETPDNADFGLSIKTSAKSALSGVSEILKYFLIVSMFTGYSNFSGIGAPKKFLPAGVNRLGTYTVDISGRGIIFFWFFSKTTDFSWAL
jgi:beta-glucosidase